MTDEQFELAWEIAMSDKKLVDFDDSILDGCGLDDFQPIKVPIEVVAKLLRWQCFPSFGGSNTASFDMKELQSIKKCLSNKVYIC